MASGFNNFTIAVRAILIANVVVWLAAYPAELYLNHLFYETETSFELIEQLTQGLLLLRLGLFGLGVIAVLPWIYFAWRNLVSARLTGLRYSPIYAVALYFIPVLNLYEPLRSMRELYNRSAGEDAYQADAEVGDATAWWGCTLAAAAVNLFLWYKTLFNTNGFVWIVAHWAIEMAMNFMAYFLVAGSAFFLFRLVGKVGRAQRGMGEVGAAAEA